MKVRKHSKAYSDRNLRLGITFLVFLFLILWGFKAMFTDRFIEGQTISNAYGLRIVDDVLPEESPLRTKTPRTIKYIVIHETANHTETADAASHANYLQTGGDGSTSWHYTVDDSVAFHHIPDDETAYHAGKGNSSGIGIELCVNNGSDFEKTFENGAKLTAKLINTYGLSINAVKQHADFMNKNCPENIRNSQRWDEFISLVKKYLKEN